MGIKVPDYNEPQVAQSVGPNARVDAPGTIEAFGGGRVVEGTTTAAKGLAKEAGELMDQEALQADRTHARSKAIALKKEKQRMLWDPGQEDKPGSGGVMSRRGQAAFGAAEEFGSAFDKRAKELEAELGNDRQKAMFRRVYEGERLDLDDSIGKHIFREAQSVETETDKALVEVSAQEAELNYMDPDKRDLALDTIEMTVMESAKRNGVKGPVAELMVKNAIADTHAKILRRMLANGEDQLAKDYYDDNLDELGKETTALAKELKIGNVRGEAVRTADEITESALGLSDALEAAAKIEDADVRIETENRLTTYYSRKRQAEEEGKKELYLQATNILEASKGTAVIPPSIISRLDLNERDALTRYSEKLQGGKESPANGPRYYELRKMAADPTLRARFTSINLLHYKADVTKSEMHELIGLQSGIKSGDEKTNKLVEGFQSDLDIVKKTAKDYGIDGDDEVKEFYALVGREQVASQLRKGRKLTDEEMQGIADRLGSEVVTSKGWIWDTKKRVFQIKKGEEFEAAAGDVPVLERRKIEEALTQTGQKVTDEAVAAAYNRMLKKRLNGN